MIKNAVLAVALAGMSGVAAAAPSEGDIEVVFSLANSRLVAIDGETYFLANAHAGYFLDMHHEVGALVGFQYNTISDETLDVGAFYRYNFVRQSADTQWWYVGAELGLPDVTEEFAEPLLIRPHIGQKYMLSDDVAFDWNAGFEFDLSDAEREEVIDVRLGLSIFF